MDVITIFKQDGKSVAYKADMSEHREDLILGLNKDKLAWIYVPQQGDFITYDRIEGAV